MPRHGQLKGTPERRSEFVRHLRTLGPGDECVYWPWSEQRTGYVRVYVDGQKVLAHRWVYEQIIGPLPERHGPGATGVLVMHACDNPPCVRPSHLSAGTNHDNLHDAAAKGRMSRGERNGRAKLTEHDIDRIKSLANSGSTQRAIAAAFGISQTQVGRVLRGETWAHRDGS